MSRERTKGAPGGALGGGGGTLSFALSCHFILELLLNRTRLLLLLLLQLLLLTIGPSDTTYGSISIGNWPNVFSQRRAPAKQSERIVSFFAPASAFSNTRQGKHLNNNNHNNSLPDDVDEADRDNGWNGGDETMRKRDGRHQQPASPTNPYFPYNQGPFPMSTSM